MPNQNDWTADFIRWIDASDLLFKRYEHLGELLQSYLVGPPKPPFHIILEDRDTSSEIVQRFPDVLGNCNEISYDEPGAVEAYVILHFLNRYRRFQLVFRSLVEQRLLPTRTDRRVELLDIGTGPAPSLYALSDAYDLLKIFGKEKSIESLANIDVQSDYVERSHRFRDWLHFFTEYVNAKSGQYFWNVPYHHGSFYDFNEIELIQPIYRYYRHTLTSYLHQTKKVSYDLIIFSNFLTTKETLENFKDEIYQSVSRLRNRGLFLVVGATGKDYPAIYGQITDFIENNNYSNYKFNGSCKKIIPDMEFKDSFDDKFGAEIKVLFRLILERLKYLGIENKIPNYPQDILSKTIHPDFSRGPSWKVLVFQKRSFVRQKWRR